MTRRPHGIAIYIQRSELERRGYREDAEGIAAYAREALLAEGMPTGGMTLEVYDGKGGIMLFCEPHQRTMTRFGTLQRLIDAATAVRGMEVAGSALWRWEDGWYLELRDSSDRVWRATAGVREYGDASCVTHTFLSEHGSLVADGDALGAAAQW